MTDTEIIKALEIHASDNMREYCEKCPYNSLDYCSEFLCEDVLNLIKRQQVEIERLNNELNGMNELVKLAPKYGQEE